MIEQLKGPYTKELNDAQKARMLEQILTMVDMTVEWIDENEFYLRDVRLTEKAEILKDWVSEEKKAAERIFKSIEEIVKASIGNMNPRPDTETVREMRKQLTEKYGEVFQTLTPPVQALVFDPCEAPEENPIATIKEKEVAPLKVTLPGIGEIEKLKGGCIGYHMGNNNVVVAYDYEGREHRSEEDEFKSAKSYWESFCKDYPDGPRKDVRIHVRYGKEVIRSEDNLFHFASALNRTVDRTFTPVIVS